MKNSYEGIGQWAATFACSDVAEGQVVSCHGRTRDLRSSRRPPVKPEIHGQVGGDGRSAERRAGEKSL